jgi:peptidoglycan/xylan/chitin deacetylase (PgdA/CDA1 family)
MKEAVKHALMNAYLASRFPLARDSLYARFGLGRLTVLTYHQVKNPASDYSTVSPAAFREQMEFLKQHYCVARLSEAVKAVSAPGGAPRLVAITFDDGYQDNATIAAPILHSLGLPACFFVATDMIGSSRPFPHDVIQGKKMQEHMTWQQLRSLVRDGFEIGSHTCGHVDLGSVSIQEAEHELRASRCRLEDELGVRIRLFAFPYGHRRNMRPATIAAARREYAVCCSAYGGHNTVPVNPGNIRRVVISTGVTFLTFRALLEGWPMMRLDNPYRAPEENAADQPSAS